MRIGTLGYRTRTGLGYQVLSYTKHLPITKVLAVDLSKYNGLPLTDWYEGADTVSGYPDTEALSRFLTDIEVVLLAETPLNYDLFAMARERGIKTALVPNWEFFDYFTRPELPLPDLFIAPSLWHYKELSAFAEAHGKKCVYIHHPVDRTEFPYKQRTTARFMHIAGKPAAYDRNGTEDYLQSDPTGTVVTQDENYANRIRRRYRHVRVLTNVDDPYHMYQFGDVLVFPRRYGGNCLPLNEALSTGMPVIMPDIEPNHYLLPKEWLVPATVQSSFTPRTKIDIYQVDPIALQQKLEWFRSIDIARESEKANQIADTISWPVLKEKFMQELAAL